MPLASFYDLAAEFCAATGSAAPELTPDPGGVVSFNVRLRDVEVFVSHLPAEHPDHAFVLVMFGQVPHERQWAAWRELLRANLLMLGAHAPSFSLHPLDDQVILQYAYPLSHASGEGLLAGTNTLVDEALAWRDKHRLEASP